MEVYDTNDYLDEDAAGGLPISGRIAPGKKELTVAALRAIPDAQALFDEGERSGQSYDDIERFLKDSTKGKFTKTPTKPLNTPYFRVARGDFSDPRNAAVFDQWKEDRGEGRELYRFPVVFPTDKIDEILQWGFETWKGKKLVFRRDREGHCVTLPEPQKGRRRFGKRDWEIRKEVCDPNKCDEFANRQCEHTAYLYFYVPDLTGLGVVQMKFHSIYARVGIKQTLRMAQRGLGRIAGTFGGKPMFWLSKREESKSYLDYDEGRSTRVKQQIIQLDAPGINMMQFFIAQEQGETAGLITQDVEVDTGSSVEQPEPRGDNDKPPAHERGEPEIIHVSQGKPRVSAENKANPVAQEKEPVEPPASSGNGADTDDSELTRAQLFGIAKQLTIDPTKFGLWATKMYGRGCFDSQEKMGKMLDALKSAKETGDVSAWDVVTDPNVPF